MDDWIRNQAKIAQSRRSATVHVCVELKAVVAGLFAFATEQVAPSEVSRNAAGGLTDSLQCILLARLALRLDLRGEGNGPLLLWEALSTSRDAAVFLPAKLLILDAMNERLALWYQSLGFVRFKNYPLRLYMPMKKIEASLAAAEQAAFKLDTVPARA